MDTKKLQGLLEAYSQVHAPEQLDEAYKELPTDKMRGQVIKHAASGTKRAFLSKFRGQKGTTAGNVEDAKATISLNKAKKIQGEIENREKMGSVFYQGSREGRALANKRRGGMKEGYDIFDVVLEFLQTEGYAETLEEAEWMMANVIDEEAIDIILEAYVDYRKGKLSTGKSPQQTLAGRHERVKATAARERGAASSTDSLMTPATKRSQKLGQARREMDANTSFGGKVNKVVNLGRRDNAGPSVQRGEPNTARHQQAIDARAKKPRNEEYVDEAQHARENPEKYEREQEKKYAPVRGEKTPMPPRGDKRREDFEKWYAKNVR